MSNLVVIDVSAMIHFGCNSEYYQDRTFYGYPVGGIHYLMREVVSALAKRDHVVLCFDSPSFRLDIATDYKSGRVKNATVISQIETVYESLLACGIRCEKHNRYEADDVIDWVCQENVGKYPQIDIVGNDIDLCHSIQNGVRFKSIVPNTPIIYYGNFQYTVVQGKKIRFNTISAYKVFAGCSSDKIPALQIRAGLGGFALYQKFLQYVDTAFPDATYKLLTDYRLPISFGVKSGLFEEDEMNELYRRVQLVYPAEKPTEVQIEPVTFAQVNKEKLLEFLAMYGDKTSLGCLSNRRPDLTEKQKDIVRKKAKKLQTGEFAADRSVEPVSKVAVSTLQLKSFVREF